jgi:hypothetical protein
LHSTQDEWHVLLLDSALLLLVVFAGSFAFKYQEEELQYTEYSYYKHFGRNDALSSPPFLQNINGISIFISLQFNYQCFTNSPSPNLMPIFVVKPSRFATVWVICFVELTFRFTSAFSWLSRVRGYGTRCHDTGYLSVATPLVFYFVATSVVGGDDECHFVMYWAEIGTFPEI